MTSEYRINKEIEGGPDETIINLVLTGLTDSFRDWVLLATPEAKHFAKNILNSALESKRYNVKQKELFNKAIRYLTNPDLIRK